MDYLLPYCDVAKALWDEIFNRTSIAWVMPRRLVDLLACRGVRYIGRKIG